jgi:hypothetical protein
MLFLRDDKFYAPFFTDPKTHFGKSDKLAMMTNFMHLAPFFTDPKTHFGKSEKLAKKTHL